MKRFCIAIVALFLLPFIAEGQGNVCSDSPCEARMSLGIVAGSGAAVAGCSQAISSFYPGVSYSLPLGDNNIRLYGGFSFTSSGTAPIEQVTLFLGGIGTPTGNITAYLCADDTNKPTAYTSCTSIGTIDETTIRPLSESKMYTAASIYYPTGYAQSAATEYWIVLNHAEDASNYVIPMYNAVGSHRIVASSNGTTWTDFDVASEPISILTTCPYATGTIPVQGSGAFAGNYDVGNGSRYRLGGSFIANGSYCLSKIAVPLAKTGTPPHNLAIKLYASDGATPPLPTGTPYTIASVDPATLASSTTVGTFMEYTLGTCQNLTDGTKYFITFEAADKDSSNYYVVGQVTVSNVADLVLYATSSWASSSTGTQVGMFLFK